MRFSIRKSTSFAASGHQRNSLANALWIAMRMLDQPGSGKVTITDHETDIVYDEDAIRALANVTPAWKASGFDAPD